MFLDVDLITYHLNIGVQVIFMFDLGMPTFCWSFLELLQVINEDDDDINK